MSDRESDSEAFEESSSEQVESCYRDLTTLGSWRLASPAPRPRRPSTTGQPETLESITNDIFQLIRNGPDVKNMLLGSDSTPKPRLELTRSSSADGLKSYTRLVLPSNKLVERAAQSEETVRAVRMLSNALALRAEYIPEYEFYDSPCVLPPILKGFEKWGSREPRFCPDAAPILPNLEGFVDMREGVYRIALLDPSKLERTMERTDEDVSSPKSTRTFKSDISSKSCSSSRSKFRGYDVIDLIRWKRTSLGTFLHHLKYLMKVAQDPVCKSFCYQRCKHLEERFSFHLLFNGPAELEEVRNNCHRDFYNVRKVDTHVHHSACMTQKHLLRFIRRKYRTCGDEPVCYADNPKPAPNMSAPEFVSPPAQTAPRVVDTGDTLINSPLSAPPCNIVAQGSVPQYAPTELAPITPTASSPKPDKRILTLKELFAEELGLSAWEASIDHLDVHAINSCFHRFDIFNTKYNPFGAAKLREVFLKTDNMLQGRYLAELTQEVIDDLESAKYQQVEWRISIYGHSPDEWLKLARWLLGNKLQSRRVRWIIQVPRLYHIYRRRGNVANMAELLRNVFEPLIKAVLRPEENREIFMILHQLVGWDSVDDESMVSVNHISGPTATGVGRGNTSEGFYGLPPVPEDWCFEDNPSYEYWLYYMYENIKALNALLQLRGMNPLLFRPHCGEAGSITHLGVGGLLADNINHGIMLRKSPVLTYLYYLWQIKIAVSPLSNNALFHEIKKTPFFKLFKIGHHLSLSTDDPLMFHFTDESLLEEYSVMTHLFKFTQVDLCEIARNSVLQSNFEPQFKRHWLGQDHAAGINDISATNVPNIRIIYRQQTLKDEYKYLRDILLAAVKGNM